MNGVIFFIAPNVLELSNQHKNVVILKHYLSFIAVKFHKRLMYNFV
jgi:hypothetical protein